MKRKLPVLMMLVAAAVLTVYWLDARERRGADGLSELHGNVDIREVSLGFRVPGRIVEVLREEGDAVKEGEVIARLDAEPYRREVEEARAQVAALEARLGLLEAGPRPQEIAQAAAVVREREATREHARRLAERQRDLHGAETVSQQEYEDAEARFREAEARLNSAREQLALLEAGFRAEEIAQARAERARAEALQASAVLRLSDTEIRAPNDGVVLTRTQEPGAIVAAGATILTISLTEPVWVRAYVPEPALGRVHPGLRVEVFTDTRPDQPYRGQVGYISPRAEFTPKSVETAELRTSLVYRLRVVVENPDAGLRQGMPVTVRLK